MSGALDTEQGTIPYDLAARTLGVVVGFDGSENATAALRFAAREAERRNTSLTVVKTYRVPPPLYTMAAAYEHEEQAKVARGMAGEVLDKARAVLGEYAGPVEYRKVEGDSVGGLVDLSSRAQLMVIGARGRGGFIGAVLGSVSSALPAHAQCPTIVVPQQDAEDEAPDAAPPRVVAGVDQSPLSRVAALHAAHAAQVRGTSLHLLMALPPLNTQVIWYQSYLNEAAAVTERRRVELAAAIDGELGWLRGHFPGLTITGEVTVGLPAHVLRQAAATAGLIVVGSRGRGRVASALLGSTSMDTLHESTAPVMVVPALADDRLEGQPATAV